MSVLDFISDPKRVEAVIGLQYVVEMKILESDKSVIKCNLCNVKGQLVTMKEHLVGTNHIKLYMEKYYFSVLQSLKRSGHHKAQFNKLLKDYAKEIERAEGTQGVKIEYVSVGDMKKEQENWMTEQEERLEFRADQKKFQPLDRRQMALNYSEHFKISSREEATIVLNLTQQLSNQLEQYFLKYKGLDLLDSTMPDSSATKSAPTPTNFPLNIEGQVQLKSEPNKGCMNKMHTEEPSSTSVSTLSVHAFGNKAVKLEEDARGLKRKSEVSEIAPHGCDALETSSSFEFQSRKRIQHKELDHFSSMQSSSFSYRNDLASTQNSSTKTQSSHSPSIEASYTHNSVIETSGREIQMVKDISLNSISQNSFKEDISNIEAVKKSESLNDTNTTETDVSSRRDSAVPGPSSVNSNCSYAPTCEKSSSSHPQGRTSKTLSPDILQLLKGKDAHTVTNILRTLSPFYPALQEVNLEIFAQVLVNTGALD